MTFLPPAALVLLLCISFACAGRNNNNAYDVLGVSKDASQDDIRRQYRKLCLQYHPDKNVSMSPKARERCEERFKQVQQANEEIGDEASRRRYDLQQSNPFSSQRSSSTAGMDQRSYEDFFRSYMSSSPPRTRTTMPFYVNGIDISDLFSGRSAAPWTPRQFKSIYVQKVSVPLQDLYVGKPDVDLELKDSLWQRYRAACRGGVAVSVLYQSALFCLPLLRMGLSISLLAGAALVHTNLPRPTKLHYSVNIRRGWKGGTKLTFQESEPGFDVVFILEEECHKRYKRVGNDLHTSISISKKQARQGCIVEVEPLSPYEAPISLTLKPRQVTRSGQCVTLSGRGWPRRQGGRGNLVVRVDIASARRSI